MGRGNPQLRIVVKRPLVDPVLKVIHPSLNKTPIFGLCRVYRPMRDRVNPDVMMLVTLAIDLLPLFGRIPPHYSMTTVKRALRPTDLSLRH